MNTLVAVVFALLAATAYAKPSGHWGGWDDGSWDGGWDDGSWGGDDGSWGGHGHYSNAVLGNGAVSVGAAGPILNDVGHGHGVAIVGPPTATVKVVGPGRTGSIVAHGLWGPTHAHGHGHW